MNGLFAFFFGVLTIIGALVFGRIKGSQATKSKMEVQIKTEQAKAEKAETEKELVVEAAKEVKQITAEDAAIQGYFEEFRRDYVEAEEHEDIDYAIEAARKLAERATNWQQRNRQ